MQYGVKTYITGFTNMRRETTLTKEQEKKGALSPLLSIQPPSNTEGTPSGNDTPFLFYKNCFYKLAQICVEEQ